MNGANTVLITESIIPAAGEKPCFYNRVKVHFRKGQLFLMYTLFEQITKSDCTLCPRHRPMRRTQRAIALTLHKIHIDWLAQRQAVGASFATLLTASLATC